MRTRAGLTLRLGAMAALIDVPESLSSVQNTLGDALSRVEDRLALHTRSDLPPVEALCRHVERYRGKMVRPALVVLSGLAASSSSADGCGSDVPEALITVGAVCELIHMATLVHDDVLDEADTRRRGETVNRLSGNETAVILGDYLFSSAYHLCSTLDSQETARRIALVGMTLCEGELLQLHHRGNLSLDEATYYEIIKRKTASLIAAACGLGAMHGGGDGETAERLHEFGLSLGVAFQIQDDLLDLTGEQEVVGKSVGKDLEKRKLTLPLIHHLATAPARVRARTLGMLTEGGEGGGLGGVDDAALTRRLRALLEETGSVEHARLAAEARIDEAKAVLAPVADSPALRFLLTLADAVVKRRY